MSYRNKTYVAFASEDIHCYRLMEAWRENEHIDFNFYDAHDLFISRDDSLRETIKRNLRSRMQSAKQVVLIGSSDGRQKGGDGYSFLAHEIDLILELKLPLVIANVGGSRSVLRSLIPEPIIAANHYSVSVAFQPSAIRFALDNYVNSFNEGGRSGLHFYNDEVYQKLRI